MGRRIEVELTSTRDDGSWTWRAAGAKQPKGDLLGSLLYDGAKVGDVVKAEAEFHLDGIEITEVFAPKQKRERTDLLELKTRPLRDDELVTTQRVARSERQGDRKGGRGRARGRGGDREDRRTRGGERGGPRPEADRRPRPKRLRPKRVHRDALLAEVTEEHRPIVEQVLKDGMPGVRAAIEKQNAEAKEAGKPEIDATPILAIAEKNLGKARLAEWRDRADAALADSEELDIRDLRSVVVAGTDVARDDESRALVDQIKSVLDARLESDHAAWLRDLDAAVSDGRVVRGLRLSSRPVKAGAPLPTEIASKLAEQASAALAPDVMQDRWATVLDALAFSPVRGAVTPVGVPPEPSEELLAEVRRLSDRIPAIATMFGIDPAQVPKSAKRRRPPRKGQKDRAGGQSRGGRGERRDRDGGGPRKGEPSRPAPRAEQGKATDEQSSEPTPSVEGAPTGSAAPTDAQPEQAIAPADAPDSQPEQATAPADTQPEQAIAPADAPDTQPEQTTAPADAPDSQPKQATAPADASDSQPKQATAPADAQLEPEAGRDLGSTVDAPEPEGATTGAE